MGCTRVLKRAQPSVQFAKVKVLITILGSHFATTSTSWHLLVTSCSEPSGQSRKSIKSGTFSAERNSCTGGSTLKSSYEFPAGDFAIDCYRVFSQATTARIPPSQAGVNSSLGQYEHIVLVHYREIKEGNKAGHMRSINTERSLQMANSGGLVTSLSCSTQPHTNSFLAQKTYASSPSISECNGPTQSSEFEEGESGDDVGAALSVEAESSSAEQGSSRQHLNRKEDLVVDSRVYQPQSYLKASTNSLAENNVSYSLFNVNEVGPGQYSFLGLEQSEQGNFSEHIDESELNMTFQDTCLHDYNNGENLSLIHSQGNYSGKQIFSPVATSGLSGCNYSGMQTKNVDIGVNEINNGHGINLSSWTEVLELCKSGSQNATDETKVPCLQSMTSEDIDRRQTNIPMETFVINELSGRQRAYTDTRLPAFAREDVPIKVEQMGSHRKFTSNSTLSVDQQQMAGPGYGLLDACEQKKSIFRDSEEAKESVYQHNYQERKRQAHNNDNSQLSQNEYSVKLKAESGSHENPFYPQIPKQLLQQCSSEAGGQEGLKKMDSFG